MMGEKELESIVYTFEKRGSELWVSCAYSSIGPFASKDEARKMFALGGERIQEPK